MYSMIIDYDSAAVSPIRTESATGSAADQKARGPPPAVKPKPTAKKWSGSSAAVASAALIERLQDTSQM